MGYALIWIEALATALFALAVAVGWTARGRLIRGAVIVMVWLAIVVPMALLTYASWNFPIHERTPVRTPWYIFLLTWLVGFVVGSFFVTWHGLRRGAPGLARGGAAWPRRRMWLGVGVTLLALGFTVWNIDLAERADLAIARQEAGALLLSMTQPPVPESENAARVYAQAIAEWNGPVKDPIHSAARRGLDARDKVDWKDPELAALVKTHESTLALLRKAAAMPRCSFDRQRTIFDGATDASGPKLPGGGASLLAIDARIQAQAGNLPRAFEDVSALLGITRHVAAEYGLIWGGLETMAWRTLEEVLHLTPPGKELPPLHIPEMYSLVRKVREEHALLGIIFPAAAAQPSLVAEQFEKRDGPLAVLLVDLAVVPSRVFLVPDEVAAMRRLADAYQRSPRLDRDETPSDWAELQRSVAEDPTGYFGARYIKPKHRKLFAEGLNLAALRQTARTGVAVEAFRRKHGKPPERLEQLVPEFLPAAPVDPRDGQVLRLKRAGSDLVIYAPQDAAALESSKLRDRELPTPAPIFRLPSR